MFDPHEVEVKATSDGRRATLEVGTPFAFDGLHSVDCSGSVDAVLDTLDTLIAKLRAARALIVSGAPECETCSSRGSLLSGRCGDCLRSEAQKRGD